MRLSPLTPIFDPRVRYGDLTPGDTPPTTLILAPTVTSQVAVIAPMVTVGPTVTINQGGSQSDPIHYGPIVFDVVFSESVTGFTTGDVTLSGTAGATSAVVSGSGATYTVTVSGMTSEGTVIASIPGGVATATSGGMANNASTSTDNTVTYVCNDNDDPFTDDFDRPDYGPGVDGLGACWAAENIPSPVIHWAIVSNEMSYTGASGTFRTSPDMTPRIDFSGPDFTVDFDLLGLTGTSLTLQIKLRSDGVDDYYLFEMANGGLGGPDLNLSISKVVGGTPTTLGTASLTNQGSGGASPLIPERVRCSAIGSALKLETYPIGGGSVTTHISVSNSDITTGNKVAFRALTNQNANPIRIDNVEVT
jgi:hypothetical protein